MVRACVVRGGLHGLAECRGAYVHAGGCWCGRLRDVEALLYEREEQLRAAVAESERQQQLQQVLPLP